MVLIRGNWELGIWEFSVLSLEFSYKCKTVLKQNVYLKKKSQCKYDKKEGRGEIQVSPISYVVVFLI